MLENPKHIFKISDGEQVLYILPCIKKDYSMVRSKLELPLEFDEIPYNKVIKNGEYTICRLHINNSRLAKPLYELDYSINPKEYRDFLYNIEEVGGIYKIENKVNGKVYIGKSRNCRSRLQKHLSDLRWGRHRSDKLQKDFDKYGEDNFFAAIIEYEYEEYKLYLLENKYIGEYNSAIKGYNVVPQEDWELIYKILDRKQEYGLQIQKAILKLIEEGYLLKVNKSVLIERDFVYSIFGLTTSELRILVKLISYRVDFGIDEKYTIDCLWGGDFEITRYK